MSLSDGSYEFLDGTFIVTYKKKKKKDIKVTIITVLNYPKYSSGTSHLSVRKGGKGLKDFGGSHGFEAKWRWGGGAVVTDRGKRGTIENRPPIRRDRKNKTEPYVGIT